MRGDKTDSTAARVIIDLPADGDWNMAADEFLLTAANAGSTTIRFYTWALPTVSLGYFQSVAARDRHQHSRHCPWVRRSTGGGAIVHDRELTYCFATPVRRAAGHSQSTYDLFHDTLVQLLARYDISATRYGVSDPQRERHFLCFQRRSAGDVMLADCKIAGSAQRRVKNALLQQGSILIDRSSAAPQLPGICQLAARAIDPNELAYGWLTQLARRFTVQAVGLWTQEERRKIQELADSQFRSKRWRFRR